MTTVMAEGASADGRRLRAERTRRQLAEALLELLEEGHPHPTAREVAARAGVSIRSVFQRFSDVEELFVEAASIQRERHWSQLRGLDPDAPLEVRARVMARQLGRLYEAIAPVRRAAAREESTSQEVAAILARARRALRRLLSDGFQTELARMPRPAASRSLDAVDVATSWETWEQLRGRLGRSRRASEEVLADMMMALLGGAT